MHSRCNGTRVFGDYEIGGSVTAVRYSLERGKERLQFV
jgi:hypothetical protein